MWSMHEASIYDLPIPCMIEREWVDDEKINVCAFSRTGVLSATFLHSLAGVHQNCSPAIWFSQCQTLKSHMHASWLLLHATATIHPSNYKLLAMTASAYELVGVCIFTLDFPGPRKLGQTARQVSVSCIILLYVWSNSSHFISSLDLLSYSNLNQ